MVFYNRHMEKIKSYRVTKKGHRGLAITIPTVWARDNELQAGDELEIFRDSTIIDRLIIQPKKQKQND